MNITDIIKPIELLRGTHNNTGVTGRGCFMNVIAYLNGEPQITDRSPCVCFVVRPIAIWLNDFASTEQRAHMLPLIEQAMGSRTEDRAELIRRAKLAAKFAQACKRIAANAANAANAAAYAAAVYAAADANAAAYAAAVYAAADADAAAYAAAVYDAAAADAAAAYAAAAANAADAATNAADAAAYAAANAAARQQLFEAGLACLDAMLPPAQEPSECVIERAHALVALTEETK